MLSIPKLMTSFFLHKLYGTKQYKLQDAKYSALKSFYCQSQNAQRERGKVTDDEESGLGRVSQLTSFIS